MNRVDKEALDFLEEARKAFQGNEEYTTYRNEHSQYIALRCGLHDRDIMVYELGNAVGRFTDQLI